MSVKYIISATDYFFAKKIAESLQLRDGEFQYVKTDSFSIFRKYLYGLSVEHESQLIGNFTKEERNYLIKGNHKREYFSFSKALELLKQGRKVKRKCWGGFWFIPNEVNFVDGFEKININQVIVAKLKDNKGYAPAQPYQEDLLAEDWHIV